MSSFLSVPLQLAISLSIQKLSLTSNSNLSENKASFEQFKYWGRINGIGCDYDIIMRTRIIKDFIEKTFYWSTDNAVTFSLFPQIQSDPFILSKAPLVKGMFTGNPGHLYKISNNGAPSTTKEKEPSENKEDETEADEKVKVRSLKEIERLAFVLNEIENSSCLVPYKLLTLSSNKDIYFDNNNNNALTLTESLSLSNYRLFRNPLQGSSKAARRKFFFQPESQGTAVPGEFLDKAHQPEDQDSSEKDLSLSVWSINNNSSPNGIISFRSLTWPGFTFQIEPGTNNIASSYLGLGEKNEDLPFIL